MKTITRRDIQRMGGSQQQSVSRSGGGGSGSGGGGGVSQGWVDENYVSKEFFNRMFAAKYTMRVLEVDPSTTPATVISDNTSVYTAEPNVIPQNTTETDEETGYVTTVTYVFENIQALGGLWTNSYVSALGQGSGGGGGGGASALTDLLDVAISNPTNGQVLKYNSTTNKWYNGNDEGLTSLPWSSITNKPTTLGGYGITDAYISGGTIVLGSNSITPLTNLPSHNHDSRYYISNGTIVLGSNSITPLTSLPSHNHDGRYYIDNGVIYMGNGNITPWTANNHPTTVSDYGITDLSINNGTGTITIGSNSITPATQSWVNSQGFLTSSTTFWGRNVSGGVVQGSIEAGTNGGAIEGFHSIELNTHGSLSNYGGFIDFHYNGSGSDYTARIIESASGALMIQSMTNNEGVASGFQVGAHYNGSYVQIGNYRLVATSDGLQVIKSDNTAANLYATGAVSALGFSAGTSSVDAMTFGYLKVNTRLNLPTNIVAGNSPMIVRTASDNDCVYMFYSSAYSKVTSYTYYYNQYDNVGLRGTDYNYDDQWWIDPDGCARFRRLYLDATRYLYVSGSTLYFYNGSTSKQVAFTN